MMLMCFPRSSLELHIFPQPPHSWHITPVTGAENVCLFVSLIENIGEDSSLLVSKRGRQRGSLSCLRGSGVVGFFVWDFPTWIFKPSSNLKMLPHWSHLTTFSAVETVFWKEWINDWVVLDQMEWLSHQGERTNGVVWETINLSVFQSGSLWVCESVSLSVSYEGLF